MVGVLGRLFRTAGHTVRTQHGVTASAGQRRGDVEIRSYLRDQAGSRSLVFDLSIAHDRFGSSSHVQQNGTLSNPQDLDGPLRVAAQRKINAYRQQYISFLPAIMSTSTRMHGEFLRLRFLQGDRGALHCRWNAIATQSIGLVPFQARSILPVAEEQSRTRGNQSGGVEDQPQCQGLWHSSSPSARSFSRSPSPPTPSFTQSPSPPRLLVRDGQTSPQRPRLVVTRSTCPPISPSPHANSFVIVTALPPFSRRSPFFASHSCKYDANVVSSNKQWDTAACVYPSICRLIVWDELVTQPSSPGGVTAMRATIAELDAQKSMVRQISQLANSSNRRGVVALDRAGREVAVALRAHSSKNSACVYNVLGVAYLSLGDNCRNVVGE